MQDRGIRGALDRARGFAGQFSRHARDNAEDFSHVAADRAHDAYELARASGHDLADVLAAALRAGGRTYVRSDRYVGDHLQGLTVPALLAAGLIGYCIGWGVHGRR